VQRELPPHASLAITAVSLVEWRAPLVIRHNSMRAIAHTSRAENSLVDPATAPTGSKSKANQNDGRGAWQAATRSVVHRRVDQPGRNQGSEPIQAARS
jgi:hypothetical protein